MSRIETKFRELKKRGEQALIAYVSAGDPTPSLTPGIVETLSKHADIIELGLPFSDPIADGPTIQAASVRALSAGMKPRILFDIVKNIRKKSEVPLVVMTYYNPVLKAGVEQFVRGFKLAGGDGIIIPDLPVEEAGKLQQVTKANNIDLIFLVAPTTPPERLGRICQLSSGFLYLVSLLGVTGARKEFSETARELITRARRISGGRIPLAIGFGISRPEHVSEAIKQGADGVIVGSAFIDRIAKNLGNEKRMLEELEKLAAELKAPTEKK
jgi:tryptophan synthase alpha chain